MRKLLILPLFLLLLSCGGKRVASEAPGTDLNERPGSKRADASLEMGEQENMSG